MPKPIPAIVLQYGKFDLTQRCIQTLRAQSVPVEIILVDGNSPGKTSELLNGLGSQADLTYFLDQNLGYAGANNVAIRDLLACEDAPPYFFILNNDTELEPDCLYELAAAAERYPRAGQLCPQVVYGDGRLQAAGATVYRPLFEPRLRGHLEPISGYSEDAEVGYAPGMAVLVRTQAAREAGELPERYFMYGEDVDWSLRFQRAGWDVRYVSAARLTHFESANIGAFSERKGYYLTRANVLLARIWLKEPERSRVIAAVRRKLLRQSLKNALHPAYVKGMWRGFADGLEADA